jgi:hypothetical protein
VQSSIRGRIYSESPETRRHRQEAQDGEVLSGGCRSKKLHLDEAIRQQVGKSGFKEI